MIQKLGTGEIEQLKVLMRERGKSEASISALDERIKCLQEWSSEDITIEELDDSFFAIGTVYESEEEFDDSEVEDDI